MTEEDVLQIIQLVVGQLVSKFRFGYYAVEDMRQQGFIFALEGLERYEEGRPLENFLRVHVRNQFINLSRNKFRRKDPPCHTCPFFDPGLKCSINKCGAFTNKDDCDKFRQWNNRNNAKQILMESSSDTDGNVVPSPTECDERKELLDRISAALDVSLRGDFLRMINNATIPRARRLRVQEAIREIINDDSTEE